MADRQVKQTGKDADGDITKLCNEGQSWSPRSKRDAIRDIEDEENTYYVEDKEGRSDIQVVNGPTGKYLRTDPDGRAENNLDTLPDCED
jgi:hypothetical protein